MARQVYTEEIMKAMVAAGIVTWRTWGQDVAYQLWPKGYAGGYDVPQQAQRNLLRSLREKGQIVLSREERYGMRAVTLPKGK